MKRRRYASRRASVSLFPFLAVLICMMGALIVLLVVLVQQSRLGEAAASKTRDDATQHAVQAPTPAPTSAPPKSDESRPDAERPDPLTGEQRLEDLRWQIETLRTSREATAKRLSEQQLQLSMVEDQARQLSETLDRLEREAQAFEAARDQRIAAETESRAEVDRVRQEIQSAEEDLDRTRAEAEKRRSAFAIIPYHGGQGTDRRPIYVECLADRVILQPEEIVLLASDFQEPLGPDNPLAAALRATREYWLNTRVVDSSARAYPLLIVRSQGAHTYAACRHALRGWDDEFGYELVPDQMTLAFPEPDPSLAEILRQTVEETRARTERPVLGSGGPGPGAGTGTRTGTGQGTGTRPGPGAGPGTGVGQGIGGGQGFGSGPGGEGPGPGQSGNAGGMAGGHPGTGPNVPIGEGAAPGNGPADHGGNGPQTPTAEDGSAGEPGRTTPSGTVTQGNPDGGVPGSESPAVGAPGGSEAGPQGPPGTAGPAAAASGGGAPGITAAAAAASLADARGDNWALPNLAQGSIAIARPVLVRCEAQRIVLEAEKGTTETNQEFAYQDAMASAISPFVEAIWVRIESWGLAGPGAYWKPVLRVSVAADCDGQYAILVRLLERSGLAIERR